MKSRHHSCIGRRPGATGSARQRGFSLVEVLVTTVVFSIGLLGVNSLNALSKRASFDAVQRSTASELAYALLEDMRVNTGALDVYIAAGTLGDGTMGTEPAPACNSLADGCSPQEFALHNLWQWERMLDTGMETSGNEGTGGLVSPTACIGSPGGGGAGYYTVTIAWRGVTETSDSGLSACGAGSGLYGADDAFRRLVIVQSYIDPTV